MISHGSSVNAPCKNIYVEKLRVKPGTHEDGARFCSYVMIGANSMEDYKILDGVRFCMNPTANVWYTSQITPTSHDLSKKGSVTCHFYNGPHGRVASTQIEELQKVVPGITIPYWRRWNSLK